MRRSHAHEASPASCFLWGEFKLLQIKYQTLRGSSLFFLQSLSHSLCSIDFFFSCKDEFLVISHTILFV